jgi:hypothetical protein
MCHFCVACASQDSGSAAPSSVFEDGSVASSLPRENRAARRAEAAPQPFWKARALSSTSSTRAKRA